MRHVICHYHVFKNAGTSFDHVLRTTFGPRHLSFDGPFPFFTIDQEQLDRIILRKTEAVAFSSHQIVLPVPVSGAYRVHGVVFLRHPVLRVASIYRFKRQSEDGTPTAAAAARFSFADWLRHAFDDPHEITHVSNAQCRLLSARSRSRPETRRDANGMSYDLAVAEENLGQLTLVGRTETFVADVRRMDVALRPAGLGLTLPADLHLNATDRSPDPPEVRVARALDALGGALADRLVRANEQDLWLWERAGARAWPEGFAA